MLARNADIVRIAPYSHDCVTTGTAVGSGTTSYEVLVFGNQFRIRQHDPITKIGVPPISDLTGLTAVYIRIWRPMGGTGGAVWYRVGQSENLLSSLTAGQVCYKTLDTPIPDIFEGDYYTIRLEGTSIPAGCLLAKAVASANLYSVVDTTPTATGYGWLSQTATAGKAIPVELFGQASHMVGIGHSHPSGLNENRSMCETTMVSRPYDTYLAYLRTMTNNELVYQNMGRGGELSSDILARIAADCTALKPRYAVIDCLDTDVASGIAKLVTLTNMTGILDAVTADGIIPIVKLASPRTVSSNAIMQNRDILNADVTTLVGTYSGAFVVDVDDYIGEFRAGGDVGNKWDIQKLYDGDGSHPNPAGYYQVAKAIADKWLQPAARRSAA